MGAAAIFRGSRKKGCFNVVHFRPPGLIRLHSGWLEGMTAIWGLARMPHVLAKLARASESASTSLELFEYLQVACSINPNQGISLELEATTLRFIIVVSGLVRSGIGKPNSEFITYEET